MKTLAAAILINFISYTARADDVVGRFQLVPAIVESTGNGSVLQRRTLFKIDTIHWTDVVLRLDGGERQIRRKMDRHRAVEAVMASEAHRVIDGFSSISVTVGTGSLAGHSSL